MQLHRYRGGWAIGQQPLTVKPQGREWLIEAQPGHRQAKQWIQTTRLEQQRFPTRKTALMALEAAQLLEPGPESYPNFKAKANRQGYYRLDNQLRARRHGERWQITMASTQTLWQAAHKAHTHQLTRARGSWVLHTSNKI